MANWPSVQPSDGRIGAIDRFCMLTYQASSSAGRYAGGVASTLGFLCVVLLLSLGVAVWHANAMAQERDAHALYERFGWAGSRHPERLMLRENPDAYA